MSYKTQTTNPPPKATKSSADNGEGYRIYKNSNGINLISRKTSNEDLYYLYNGHADVTMLVNKVEILKQHIIMMHLSEFLNL